MRIKICGIMDARAAAAVVAAGADAVGFVFAESPRRISPREASRIAADLPADLERVAVFRLPSVDDVRRVLDEFSGITVQAEPEADLIAAFAAHLLPVLHDDLNLDSDVAMIPSDLPVLLEATGRGGRGIRPDWSRASLLAGQRRLMLAGGLDVNNVLGAIGVVRPWGVDVSSGVETSPGVKSPELIAEFVRVVRGAETEGMK
jgi:phosphoribosylanthranilate isomerase